MSKKNKKNPWFSTKDPTVMKERALKLSKTNPTCLVPVLINEQHFGSSAIEEMWFHKNKFDWELSSSNEEFGKVLTNHYQQAQLIADASSGKGIPVSKSSFAQEEN